MRVLSTWVESFWATHGSAWILELTLLAAVVLLVHWAFRRRLAIGVQLALFGLVIVRAVVPLDIQWERPVESVAVAIEPESGATLPPVARPETRRAPADRRRVELDSTGPVRRARARSSSRAARTESSDPEPSIAGLPSRMEPRDVAPAPSRLATWPAWLAIVWAIGVLIGLLRVIRSEWSLRRAFRESESPTAGTVELIEEAASIAGCRRIPKVAVLAHFPSPAVHGTLRQTLIIPRACEALEPHALRSILVHELFHIRRRDLLWMPVVTFAQILWWPHPLVRAVARSTRAAIEEARDQDTVAALARRGSPQSARSEYARLLVDLADPTRIPDLPPAFVGRDLAHLAGSLPFTRSRRELERRITMIFEIPQPRPASTYAGVGLVCVLGVCSFVDRVTTDSKTTPNAPATQAQESRIEVERGAPLPDWYAEIDARLDQRLASLDVDRMPLLDALSYIAEALGCPIRVPGEAHDDLAEFEDIHLSLREVTGREVLDLLTRFVPGSSWTIAHEGIFFGESDMLPYEAERRFYRVASLVDALDEIGEEHAFDALVSVVRDYGVRDPGTFDREGTSIDEWRGLLTIRVAEQDHRTIHRFLDRLSQRQLNPLSSEEPWRPRIEKALREPLQLDLEADASAHDAIRMIGKAAGITIVADDPGVIEDLDSEDWRALVEGEFVPLDALTKMAYLTDRRVDIASGAVVLTRDPTTTLHLYPLNELASCLGAEFDDLADEVVDFLYFDVAPYTWDEDPRLSVCRLGDLLLVTQYPEVHPEIAALLDQMQRAANGE